MNSDQIGTSFVDEHGDVWDLEAIYDDTIVADKFVRTVKFVYVKR